jgi:hypothetical protein
MSQYSLLVSTYILDSSEGVLCSSSVSEDKNGNENANANEDINVNENVNANTQHGCGFAHFPVTSVFLASSSQNTLAVTGSSPFRTAVSLGQFDPVVIFQWPHSPS